MTAYTSYGAAGRTPLVGSTIAVCTNCGTRGFANRTLTKAGKVRACVNCRGVPQPKPTPQPARRRRRPSALTPPADTTGTPTCNTPIQRGARKGTTATGTTTGYVRHYRTQETPCPACRHAMAIYNHERYYDRGRTR